MKVKIDFVTNSSSSSFLISVPKHQIQELRNSISDLNSDADSYNQGVAIYMEAETLKQLQEYTNDGPLDWASLPGGPNFWGLEEDAYNMAKKALEKGHIVAEVSVDNNMCEKFDSQWGNDVLKVTNQ